MRCLRLVVWTSLVLLPPPPVWATLDDAVFITEWARKYPRLPGDLDMPITNAVDDASGDVYVLERGRILKYDRGGNFLLSWSSPWSQGIEVNQVTHDVYVSGQDDTITQYTSSGGFVRKWGSSGSAPGQFNRPHGVAVDSATGNVYVMDTGNARVQIFDAVGSFVSAFTHPLFDGAAGHPAGMAFDPGARVLWVTQAALDIALKFDEFGNFLLQLGQVNVELTDPGFFRWPRSVAVDEMGRVYVVSTDSEHIQQFTEDGAFLGIIQGPNNRKDGPFHPRDIAINRITGEKYVNAAYAFRVDKFDASNNYLLSFAGQVTDGHNLSFPHAIATSPLTGDVYVFDSGHHLIKRFTAGGAFLSQFGGSLRISLTEPGLFGGINAGSALTIEPGGEVWVGLTGLFYATDPRGQFLQKFEPDGNHLISFLRTGVTGKYSEQVRHLAIDPVTRRIYASDTRLGKVQKFDDTGTLLLEIDGVGTPGGVATFGGEVYVADVASHLIRRFDSNGTFISQWGGPGSGDGKLLLAEFSGLATDSAGNIYVADTLNNRVQQFDSNGNFLGKLGVSGNVTGGFLRPKDIALSPDSSLLHVVDRYRIRILSFCLTDVGVCTAQLDRDSDTYFDHDDNCPFTANPLQEDSGGLNSTLADGTGDVCQCGEVTGDGVIETSDLVAVRELLAGLGSPFSPDRCSVRGTTECDSVDAAVLARALVDLDPDIAQVCTPAIP